MIKKKLVILAVRNCPWSMNCHSLRGEIIPSARDFHRWLVAGKSLPRWKTTARIRDTNTPWISIHFYSLFYQETVQRPHLK